MATAKASSTARGLGWKHQKNREALLRKHVDGALCWWDERPMFKLATRNWDSRPLAADHTISRAAGGTRADRLLHATCNERRGDGTKDHLRPALKQQVEAVDIEPDELDPRLMPWP